MRVFSKSSFHGYTEVLLKIVHDVISKTLATEVTRQNRSALLYEVCSAIQAGSMTQEETVNYFYCPKIPAPQSRSQAL